MPSSHRRRLMLPVLLSAVLLVPSAASAATPSSSSKGTMRASTSLGPVTDRAAQEGCRNADITPTEANEPAVREAILCLHNQIRSERGLPQLQENARLRRAAVGHADDMVRRRFFEHTTPGGATMVDRILAARYASRNVGWSLGENLAWGTGSLATPRRIMRAWMESPGHRANVVKRAYREIGIGVVTGTPSGGSGGATYTADFGVVRR